MTLAALSIVHNVRRNGFIPAYDFPPFDFEEGFEFAFHGEATPHATEIQVNEHNYSIGGRSDYGLTFLGAKRAAGEC